MSGAAVAQRRFAAPDAYTPKHLADRILTSRAALEGERKQVTVLFADLKGSMTLLADRDPEEARSILDPVLELMMEAVHRYDGTVNQVMGDGIMALFGAPLALEDHAVRGCYAALRMLEQASRYAQQALPTHGIPVQIRVGLNSGEVVVRSIRTDLHMDYTAIGQTTHLAARMEQIASPGTGLLTATTLALAEGRVRVRALGPVPVKGRDAPVSVYELLPGQPVRARFEAAVSRGLTRFVGRDKELDQLAQAFERARQGRGQVAAVVGEPGVGKSRLIWEFVHAHRRGRWLSLHGGAASYGKTTPYLPIIDLLKRYFGFHERDDEREIREKVTGKMLALDRALEPCLPGVLALVDARLEDAEWRQADPAVRRRQILDGVKRLLLRESQEQTVCVVLEDLHWIDSETQACLDGLVDALPGARLLLLVDYRPEYQHPWGGKTYYTQLRLDPLPGSSAEALIDALLGSDPELHSLRRLLVDRTDGNPFFLEETIRTLIETAVVTGQPGAYRLARSLGSVQVPATVQAVLAARIDRLPPEAKDLLQLAAVVGQDVPLSLLDVVASVPEDDLRSGLAHLQAAEFLYQTRAFPDQEYTFKHALTHEVAYQSLLRHTRERHHGRIAQVLEERFPEVREMRPELLAHHFTQAGRVPQAVAWWRQAGSKAIARMASEAVDHLARGLELTRGLPETPDRTRQELDLQTALAAALVPLIGYASPEVELAYARARDLAEQVGDTSSLFPVLLGLRIVHLVRGQHAKALNLAEQLLDQAERSRDAALLVEAHRAVGETFYYLGRLAEARPHLQRAIQLDDALEHRSQPFALGYSLGHSGVFSRAHLAFVLWLIGYPDQALTTGESALALARELRHPQSIIFALHATTCVRQYRREADGVGESARALVALSDEYGFRYWRVYGEIILDWALDQQDVMADRIARVRDRIADLLAMQARIAVPWLLSMQADLHARAGQLRDGLAVVTQALDLIQLTGEREYEAECHRLEGEFLLAHDVPDMPRAEACLGRALDVARQHAARSLELRAATSLARLLAAQEKGEEALGLLAPLVGWFSEGFDTVDLREATALLYALSARSPD